MPSRALSHTASASACKSERRAPNSGALTDCMTMVGVTGLSPSRPPSAVGAKPMCSALPLPRSPPRPTATPRTSTQPMWPSLATELRASRHARSSRFSSTVYCSSQAQPKVSSLVRSGGRAHALAPSSASAIGEGAAGHTACALQSCAACGGEEEKVRWGKRAAGEGHPGSRWGGGSGLWGMGRACASCGHVSRARTVPQHCFSTSLGATMLRVGSTSVLTGLSAAPRTQTRG
eukprot:scaffold119129_cov31-Tisochrysis_lutea.AAC.2